jgi:hypothetical protein
LSSLAIPIIPDELVDTVIIPACGRGSNKGCYPRGSGHLALVRILTVSVNIVAWDKRGSSRLRLKPGTRDPVSGPKGRFFMRKCSAWPFLLVAGLLLAGCGGGADLGPVTEAQQNAIVDAAGPALRLQPGEKIRLSVYGEATLSGDYQIDPSGLLSLPLAGPVKAAGLTQAELKQEITQKLRTEYLKNPRVTVSVVEFRPFYILGEVEKPGSYPYTSGLNALSAIAIAGGTTYRANKSTVLIQHPGESGLREYPLKGSVLILPGDIIRVPARYF